MSKILRHGGILLAAAVLLSLLLTLPAGAKPASGISLIPILDESVWEVEVEDGVFRSLNAPGAFVSTSIDQAGAITLRRTDKANWNWTNIHINLEDLAPVIDLKVYPYVYFDLTATTEWNIGLQIGDAYLGIAKAITAADPSKERLPLPETDGKAGVYKGKFNLYEYIKQEIKRIPHLTDETAIDLRQVTVYIVDTTSDHLSGEVTLRQLSIGNDDENAPDGLTLGGATEPQGGGKPSAFFYPVDNAYTETDREMEYAASPAGSLPYIAVGLVLTAALAVVIARTVIRRTDGRGNRQDIGLN